MLDDSLRRQLEALNRTPISGVIKSAPGEVASATGRKVAAPSPIPESSPRRPPAQAGSPFTRLVRPIPGLLRSGEVVQTAAGEHLRIRLPLEWFWPGGSRLVTARQEYLRQQLAASQQAAQPSMVMDGEIAALVTSLPDRVLLLDLETCGLTGAALFLAGLLRQINAVPIVELLVARNYSEEAAVLDTLWQTVAGHDVLVTFNGKAFDWPMIVERSVRHRLQPVGWAPPTSTSGRDSHLVGNAHPTMLHVDVLHHARRRWRKHLPDCRLQTLEQFICLRRRTGDVAGHLIPAVYADYVRTGFERDMDAVLYHNALDLVTLLDLTLRLAG